MNMKPLHVEVVQKRSSCASEQNIKEMVLSFLSNFASLFAGAVLERELADSAALSEHVQCVTLCDAGVALGAGAGAVAGPAAELVLHVHTLDARGAERDALPDEDVAACEAWALPSEEFHGLWESLVFESSLKADVLRFVQTALEWEARGVDARQVAWQRVLLLHGPPGTGKTSLCRALAHKLAVRLSARFPRARLLELNAHGLFSKWFSESGKLVARVFERVHELLDDPRLLVCVLIDEVESLTHARRAALAGLEPSDAMRAVNAVLAALDRLRRRPNVLVLATSNLPGAVDVAFLDRADVRRLVGPPGPRAAYTILRGCCVELMQRGVVAPTEVLFALRVLEDSGYVDTDASHTSLRLMEVARAAAARGVSARALRRLPFLAAALHCGDEGEGAAPTLPRFVCALHAALDQLLQERDELADAPAAPRAAPAPDRALSNGH